MVGFMRWVHRKSLLFICAVLAPVIAGSIFGVTEIRSSENIVKIDVVIKAEFRQCFDVTNFLIYSTKRDQCPTEYLFLGDQGLSESATASGSVAEIHPQLMQRFNTAKLFAAHDGVSLVITSAFRSLERQEILYQREVQKRGSESEAAKWVLPPHSSNHPKGLAIDVNYPMDPLGALWLDNNGWRFGLCRVYANEWWHFEAVSGPGVACPPVARDARVDLELPLP
jgi:hypothetical protein